jgi:hypothetical protein
MKNMASHHKIAIILIQSFLAAAVLAYGIQSCADVEHDKQATKRTLIDNQQTIAVLCKTVKYNDPLYGACNGEE